MNPPLGPGARSLIDAARDADRPTRADRERIKRSVLLRAGVIGAATATTATAATATAALSITNKVVILVLATAAVGGGAVAWRAAGRGPVRGTISSEAVPPRAPAASQSPPLATEAEAPPIAVAPPRRDAPESQPLEAKPRRLQVAKAEPPPTTSRRSVAAESAPEDRAIVSDPVATEVALLRSARAEIQAGRPAAALRILSDHGERFPRGALEEERRALEAIASCQLRPGAESRARAEVFFRTHPQSPMTERVRAACER